VFLPSAYILSTQELICVTTDVYFGYQKPPRLLLASLCIHKGFSFGQTLFREFTNEIETDKDAFETITTTVTNTNNMQVESIPQG
jgi:hypothetical protein